MDIFFKEAIPQHSHTYLPSSLLADNLQAFAISRHLHRTHQHESSPNLKCDRLACIAETRRFTRPTEHHRQRKKRTLLSNSPIRKGRRQEVARVMNIMMVQNLLNPVVERNVETNIGTQPAPSATPRFSKEQIYALASQQIMNPSSSMEATVEAEKKRYICRECGQSLASTETLRDHFNVRHVKSRLYKCYIIGCGKTGQWNSLREHTERVYRGLRHQ